MRNSTNLAFEATVVALRSDQGHVPAPEAPDSLSVVLRRTHHALGSL
jgi:hypothetical protein